MAYIKLRRGRKEGVEVGEWSGGSLNFIKMHCKNYQRINKLFSENYI